MKWRKNYGGGKRLRNEFISHCDSSANGGNQSGREIMLSAFYLPTYQLNLIFFNLQTKTERPQKVKSHLLTTNTSRANTCPLVTRG